MAQRTTRRIAAALGTLVVAVSMTACAGRPGTAATVGPDQISVTEVQQTTDALTELYGPVPGMSSFVLNVKMRASAAEQVAAAEHLDLRAAAEQALSAQGAPAGGDVPSVLREFALNATEVDVLQTSVGPESLAASFAKIPVTVNPRYGLTGLEAMRFDESQRPLVANPSLSKPDGATQ